MEDSVASCFVILKLFGVCTFIYCLLLLFPHTFSTAISSTPKPCQQDSLKAIPTLVIEHNLPEAKIGLASALSAFLWLYTSIQGVQCSLIVSVLRGLLKPICVLLEVGGNNCE